MAFLKNMLLREYGQKSSFTRQELIDLWIPKLKKCEYLYETDISMQADLLRFGWEENQVATQVNELLFQLMHTTVLTTLHQVVRLIVDKFNNEEDRQESHSLRNLCAYITYIYGPLSRAYKD